MSRRLEYRIEAEKAGMCVREFLKKELAFSEHQISRLKYQEDGLRVGGEKVYVNHVLREGEVLTVGLTEKVPRRDTEGAKPGKVWEAPAPEIARLPLQILYEDRDLLIVDKPAGLVCHPSPGHYNDTLANQAAAHLGGTGTVMDMRVTGRLDRETSGIVTFAKNTEAAAILQRQREEGRLVKIYLALAEGDFDRESGVVDFPLRREAPGSFRMVCAEDGKPARTFYRVLARTAGPRGEPRTYLTCRIEHGRTHQIRVHMARIGHPLAGDPLYGTNEKSGEPMGLHAFRLTFQQPFSGETVTVRANLPEWAYNLKADLV